MIKKFFLLLTVFSLFYAIAFAEILEETLVVEYSRGILPAQQALIQEMIKKGLAKPIEKDSSIKGFSFILKDPVHHILRQGRLYRRDYPLNIKGEKEFEVVGINELGDGLGVFPTGFQMVLDTLKGDNDYYNILFHAENHKLENILGKNTAKVRTFHSVGGTKVYPNSGMMIINIDGEGGFLLFTYIKNQKM